MKLSEEQANQIAGSTNLSAISLEDDVQKDLEAQLGDHTYFVNSDGLFVLEPMGEGNNALLVAVALWSKDSENELIPQNPVLKTRVCFDLSTGAVSEIE